MGAAKNYCSHKKWFEWQKIFRWSRREWKQTILLETPLAALEGETLWEASESSYGRLQRKRCDLIARHREWFSSGSPVVLKALVAMVLIGLHEAVVTGSWVTVSGSIISGSWMVLANLLENLLTSGNLLTNLLTSCANLKNLLENLLTSGIKLLRTC